jgi:hypothetical protein
VGAVRQAGPVATLPEQFRCAHCGRSGSPGDVAVGWSVSSPPRATGSTAAADDRVTALCPDCARAALRDLEGKLDP